VHLGVSLELSLAGIYPVLSELGDTQLGFVSLGTGSVVQVNVGHVGVFQMNPTKGNLEDVPGFLVDDFLVLLGGLRKGLVVGNRSNLFKVGVERVLGGLGSTGLLGVGLLGDEFFGLHGIRGNIQGYLGNTVFQGRSKPSDG